MYSTVAQFWLCLVDYCGGWSVFLDACNTVFTTVFFLVHLALRYYFIVWSNQDKVVLVIC